MTIPIGFGIAFGRAAAASAAAPSFDPAVEYMPDTGWDNAGAWSPVGVGDINATVPSAFHPSGTPTQGFQATGAAAQVLAAGTYRYTDTVANTVAAVGGYRPLRVTVGGTLASASPSAEGAFTLDIVVTAVTDQNIIVRENGATNGKNYDLLGGSLKRIA